MGRSLKDQFNTIQNQIKAKKKAAVKQQKKEIKQGVYGKTDTVGEGAETKREALSVEKELTFVELMARDGVEKAWIDEKKPLREQQFENVVNVIEETEAEDNKVLPPSPANPHRATSRKGITTTVFEPPLGRHAAKRTQTTVTDVTGKNKKDLSGGEERHRSQVKEPVRCSEKSSRSAIRPQLEKTQDARQETACLKKIPEQPKYHIKITNTIQPNVNLLSLPPQRPLLSLPRGHELQVEANNGDDEREVNIGLDFGTSSIKVVVGDPVLKKAFAVPFFECGGLAQYLLPSRIWKNEKGYSLTEAGESQRNLKLALIEESNGSKVFEAVSAVLGFVIRHARGWLFDKHRDIYSKTKILWKVTLGVPAENYDDTALVERFQKAAAAAWQISLLPGDTFGGNIVHAICADVRSKSMELCLEHKDMLDVELDVVPELSAQIYGFLESDRFDPNAENIFMIIDVGAGTIDSSVFHVQREKANKLAFTFYANRVEPNGVANLNSFRVMWFREVFQKQGIGGEAEIALEQMQRPTDFMDAIPESIADYFLGIDITFKPHGSNPDRRFYKQQVCRQILVDTLKKASERVEVGRCIKGMPVFVCGGGSRMMYYKKIEDKLRTHPNATWFRYVPRKLVVPDILEVQGVVQEEFDRLSVAFGLSFVNVGTISRATAREKETKITLQGRQACPGCGSHTICYCS